MYPGRGDTAWLEMANNVGRAAGYGGSNVMLLRNESSTDMSLVAMLASCSPVALQVQRGGGGLEDTAVSCGQKRSYYPMLEASGEDPGEEDLGDDCTQHVEKKRRLTFDQVRSLERNFEIENKLEPERKMQLAKELGLQPRQVAVWFQNRRARWKTKQLERDYEVLTSDFNRLKSEFDAVLQEKQELQGEMECLTGKLQTAQPDPGDVAPADKTETPKTSSLPASQKTREGSLRAERISEPDASKDSPTPRKEMGSKETSADSEILDADSPRTTMDSGSLLPLDNINAYPHISAEMVDSSIIHMSDHLGDQVLSPQACQRISVKLEDDSFQDDSCNYILSQLDEERGLPWWDWP